MADGKTSTIIKWVGYATAVLSLIAGVRGLSNVLSDRATARHQVESLLASEEIQRQSRDYGSAWKSLEQAAKIDPGSAPVRQAQENLAMAWLDNIDVRENEKFSDIAERLDPVLTRGAAAAASPQRQADLLAHLGWSYFLRSREAGAGLDPSKTYAEAAAKDPNNPYAQGMWGHWILWNHGDPAEANRHFAAALASNRERDFVRLLQLSALLNMESSASDEEVIRVLNAMRKEDGTLPSEVRHRLWGMYYGKIIPSNAETAGFINAVPPAEHVATFHWLFDKLDLDQSASLLRLGDLSALEEAAGQFADAQSGYDSIRRQSAGHSGPLLAAAEMGVKRLSHRP